MPPYAGASDVPRPDLPSPVNRRPEADDGPRLALVSSRAGAEHGASASATGSAIVGRDTELGRIGRWLDNGRPGLLEIEGEPGIGKTTLWEAGTCAARARGALVLSCRPVEVEVAVSYGALASLLEPALEIVGDTVPAPRLRALEGALRLRDVSRSRLDETAVALGALSLLRSAADRRPVVLAVDDVQWLDRSSRVALTYALRNLRPGDDVAVLLARRLGTGGGPLDLTGSPLAAEIELLQPGPLSLGALHRVITGRLGASLSRPKLVHVHSTSGGNPLYALELARVVAASAGAPGSAPALPASLADVLRVRLDALSTSTRRLLLVVAAAGEPALGTITDLIGDPGLDAALGEAVGQGVLVVDGGRVRFSHPLLASTAYAEANELERSRVHGHLAEAAETSEERARHLALTGSGPDESIAEALEDAARSACRRGARGAGAALYEQAAALTPADDDGARDRRLVSAGHALFQAGEPGGARAMLESVAAGGNAARFEALCRLGTLLDETVGGDSSFSAFEGALRTDDPALAARAHRCLAQALAYVGDLEQALEHADAAVGAAEPLEDGESLLYALSMQALVRKIAGHAGWRESLERALALERVCDLPDLDACPSAVEADTKRLAFELDSGRATYESMLARAAERGDVQTESWCRFGLASIEIASGHWDDAARHADELCDLAEQTGLLRLPALRTTAHVAVLRGDVARAREALATAVAEAESTGELHNLRAALQTEGLLELSLGEPGLAAVALRRARLIAESMAVGDPGLLLFFLDEVEALAGIGETEEAAAVLDAYERRAASSPSPWIAPLVQRARGVILAAGRELDGAQATLEAAVGAEESVPMPLERARARLALGRVLRRKQARREAHAILAGALAQFEGLGAALWADRAREELGRIGGRAPSSDDLTPTERRIAALVADGMTNREVAASLFVTPKTVESALTRVYRKLGVRSRTELARHLAVMR